jgi:predicted transcriptional regulator
VFNFVTCHDGFTLNDLVSYDEKHNEGNIRTIAIIFAIIRIESVMSSPAITLARHSTLVNAAEVLRMSRIGSAPIVAEDSLVGIITRSDILEAFVAFANGRYRPSRPRNRFKKNLDSRS